MTTKDILENYVDEIKIVPIILNYKYEMERNAKFMKVMTELKSRKFDVRYTSTREGNCDTLECYKEPVIICCNEYFSHCQ